MVGLLEAEAHLAIHPNNGGSSWLCSMRVALRDDDGDLLIGLRQRTGLGHLTSIPARNGSKAQTLWCISGKVECLALASILRKHPMRGRKAAEAKIWIKAVERWAAMPYVATAAIDEELRALAGEVRALRRYAESGHRQAEGAGSFDDFLAFFGGFFSGEGYLGLSNDKPRITVKLRRDDRPLLQAFRDRFEIGTITDHETEWSPVSVWNVCSRRDVLRGIEVLDQAGLLGRKERQFAAWRVAATELVTAGIEGRNPDCASVEAARRAYAAASDYGLHRVMLPPTDALTDAREAYASVLRAWAAEATGPLTCVTYMQARRQRPSWPNRNTIARAFGSWQGALIAAGLSDRVAEGYPR